MGCVKWVLLTCTLCDVFWYEWSTSAFFLTYGVVQNRIMDRGILAPAPICLFWKQSNKIHLVFYCKCFKILFLPAVCLSVASRDQNLKTFWKQPIYCNLFKEIEIDERDYYIFVLQAFFPHRSSSCLSHVVRSLYLLKVNSLNSGPKFEQGVTSLCTRYSLALNIHTVPWKNKTINHWMITQLEPLNLLRNVFLKTYCV